MIDNGNFKHYVNTMGPLWVTTATAGSWAPYKFQYHLGPDIVRMN